MIEFEDERRCHRLIDKLFEVSPGAGARTGAVNVKRFRVIFSCSFLCMTLSLRPSLVIINELKLRGLVLAADLFTAHSVRAALSDSGSPVRIPAP